MAKLDTYNYFGEFDELEADYPFEAVEGTLANLYPPGDGQYPKQNGVLEDGEGNKIKIVFSVPSTFIDADEWVGENIRIEGKYNQKYDSWNGIKVKERDNGNCFWVTATATILDENGDPIPSFDSGGQTRETGRRSPTGGRPQNKERREPPKKKRAAPRPQNSGAEETQFDVFQLTEHICEVTALALSNYVRMGLDKETAATLASGHASAVAHWWFGCKAPQDIERVAGEIEDRKKAKQKPKQRQRPDPDESFDEDEEVDF